MCCVFFAWKSAIAREFLLKIDTSLAIATSGLKTNLLFEKPPSENPPFDFPEKWGIPERWFGRGCKRSFGPRERKAPCLYRANGRGGFGSQTAADPSGDPHRTPELKKKEKQTVGTVTAFHNMLTLQALPSSLNAGTAKGGCLGRGEAFGCPLAVCPPERPRPCTHYTVTVEIFCQY